ncbi:hypothetical protein A7J50_3789 [Pseudomonas antarctica]|uniref:Uncharacterized protein n=1 Tax=Pseudomonas antarctica TaxID=219572 RepID=A0A172Z4B2_9PSED|nr:hypothetical protein [Pseudomonas antarctica]ANF87162.1 hypothetical protein A7J50_3789 [Pseudomonas antarctica]
MIHVNELSDEQRLDVCQKLDRQSLKSAIDYILKQEAHEYLDSGDQYDAAYAIYDAEVTPAAVLALIAENEESEAVINQLAKILAGVAVALKGEELPLRRHGYQDLVERVTVLKLENDLRIAENAGLKTGYEAYERVNAELKAENERLIRESEGKVLCDLELFETLRDSANTEADEHRQCMATYRPLRQANLDSVVKKCDDLLAAMGQGERS